MPRQEFTTASGLIAISPSDTTNLAASIKAIYVGSAGNLNITACDDTTNVQINNVPAGTTLYVAPIRIGSTGTTATNIVGLI
jgi:hypothetical protein